ncbi:unnamed protein product [Symbiodinium natans]|uniref:Uncharacterized protein n=1 Tax=Symbiodinium natans TaxID=878477 RepID=A0A812M0N5_9DINO|nr:unnamed protein product [Symbiodinium natans]
MGRILLTVPMTALAVLSAVMGSALPNSACEQNALLQVTSTRLQGPSFPSLPSLPGLVQHAAERSSRMDEGRLEGVRKVHSEIEAMVKQLLTEKSTMETGRNRSDYNLSSTTLAVLDTVSTEMQSLLVEINESHIADEQLLLDLAQAFVQCNTDLAQRQLQSDNLSSLVASARQSHDACRASEQSLTAANASSWAAYLAAGSEAPPETVKQCMTNFVNGHNPEAVEDLEAMTSCAETIQSWSSDFAANMTNLQNTYTSDLNAVNQERVSCRVNQSTLESHFCEYRQQLSDSCIAVDSCHENANATWHELLVSIAASDVRRESSFIAATKVICYIQVLQSNLTQPAVQECQDLTADTSVINVNIPTPAGIATCDASPVATFPCEAAWLDMEYFNKSWYTQQPQILPDTCISCAARVTTTTTTLAVVVPDNSVAAVFLSTCAVTSQVPTKLQCVGESSGGQLGGPGYPAYVDLGSRTASRVFGPTCCRFCALLDNEDLKCWGGNSNGEWQVFGGPHHVCAILDDQSLKCWGHGANGMLGFTPSNGPNVGDAPNEMGDNLPVVSFGALEGSHQVLGGSAWWHVCVLLDHPAEVTQLACFGVNGGEGRLARGNTDHHSLTPMPVDLGTGFHAVQVKCWGGNGNGQLGRGAPAVDVNNVGASPGDMGDNLPAVDLGTDQGGKPLKAIYIMVGHRHSCAILQGGAVKCWGSNTLFGPKEGQAGQPNSNSIVGDSPAEMGDHLPSVNIGENMVATELVGGVAHTCARLEGGALKCWGTGGNYDWASFLAHSALRSPKNFSRTAQNQEAPAVVFSSVLPCPHFPASGFPQSDALSPETRNPKP